MDKKILIGKKLRHWLIDKFGSITEGAKFLDISPNALSTNYFSGKSYPGGELLSKLAEIGCDLNWLLSNAEALENSPPENINKQIEIDRLEEENRTLRESIGQITILTQAVENGLGKGKKIRKKRSV